jgi:hypothetical protein
VAAAMLTHKPGTGIPAPVTTPSTPPTLTLPPGQTVEATGPDGATDSGGLNATGSFTISVQDTTPPSLNLPGNITVQAGKAAVVTYPAATATDLVDGSVPVNCSPASGIPFDLGTTTVNCSATDAHHNIATGSFTVFVGIS